MSIPDEDLEVTPVLRNLDARFRWFGLQVEDAPFAVLPMLFVFALSIPFDFNPAWSLLVAVAILLALLIVKVGKPDNYIQMELALRFSPRRLSHKQRDDELDPFPLDAGLEKR